MLWHDLMLKYPFIIRQVQITGKCQDNRGLKKHRNRIPLSSGGGVDGYGISYYRYL